MIPPLSIRERLNQLASKRILILDGAMGSMILAYRTPSGGKPLAEDDFRGLTGNAGQASGSGSRFKDHPLPLKGCNDILCLTMPHLITEIHEAYLKAGADIIETCSFNATAVSLADYGLEDYAYELNVAAARLAREAADRFSVPDKPRFVAGSMGPTSKSASMSADYSDPGKRAVTWDELEAAYYDNARGLLDGGADLLIIETIFDTLNAKAAIFAVRRLVQERGIDVPLIISATVSDNGGRLLSGQTVEAFCVSVLHADPLALGLNCSFGAEKLKPCIAALSSAAPCLVSAYPNAGLPNNLGEYDESPETMADHIEEYLREGLVNIIGACCGSTPAHIAAITAKAEKYSPRPVSVPPVFGLPKKTMLAGLKVLEVSREHGPVCIGERTNVAGSRMFRRLIQKGDYDGAVNIARDMVEEGAALIDVCMDDVTLDAKTAMTNFLNLALEYPDIASLPIVIDSSSWDVIETGLKCLQGKGLANSVSLKDGEAEFLRRSHLARAYGAAVVVMLIDEQGLAASYERRVAVASRSWKLLTESGYPPEDIVFDPIVFIAEPGVPEHDSDTPDFIQACAWIRDNCPGAQIIGGISNLSFGFRDKQAIRNAMHAVLIKHAVEHGLSMAIVNPAGLVPYDEIDGEVRDVIESSILIRRLDEARKNKVCLSWPAFSAGTKTSGASSGGKDSFNLAEIFEIPPAQADTGNPADGKNSVLPEDSENVPHIISLNNYPVRRVIPYIDWTSFLQTWELAAHTYPTAYHKASREEEKKALEKLLEDAKIFLEKIVSDGILSLRGVVGFFPACSEGDDIILFEPGGHGGVPKEAARFIFLRNQDRKINGGANPGLADFILPREMFEWEPDSAVITPNPSRRLGLFALSAGFGLREAGEEYLNRKDEHSALLLAGLANFLADAFTEEVHHRLSSVWGGGGIHPAFGSPACPDHWDKEIAFRLLDAGKRCGFTLTDTAMIIPAASICGMFITHPNSFYFGIGSMGKDQLHEWARRKGITPEEAGKRLRVV